VPVHSSQHVAAQLAAVRAGMRAHNATDLTRQDLVAAGNRLESVELDAARRTRLAIEVLEAARSWLHASAPREAASAKGPRLLGCELTEKDLRLGLERNYRSLARLSETATQRIALVDRANTVRPVTWV
jgi:serine/threonine-protein kinase PknG